jgi:hypothetical protein
VVRVEVVVIVVVVLTVEVWVWGGYRDKQKLDTGLMEE